MFMRRMKESSVTMSPARREPAERSKGDIILQGRGFCGNRNSALICVENPAIKVPDGEDGLIFMREFMKSRAAKKILARSKKNQTFSCGFVGFLSYDLGAEWQGIRQRAKKDFSCPLSHFIFTDKVYKVKNYPPIEMCVLPQSSTAKSNLTKTQYFKKIAAIKKYLFDGETYQVNFAQRFEADFKGESFDLYQKLNAKNPSPYQFFMETSDFAIISNSPERLLKITNKNIETRPIKGTCERGKTLQEDKRNIKRLLKSEKEAAELAMITDLERNDLGKICVPGSVKVNEFRAIEKYSHVIHTISNIRGRLGEKHDWYDALHALFPGGSITGCPKKRTVEIIDRLEPCQRGVYCGSAGYIDLSGNCDFNIMIRTIFIDKKRPSGQLMFYSGGGIVADSDPQREYEETLQKAAAIMSLHI